MTAVVVTRNYQITLPKEIRRKTIVSVGESMMIDIRNDEIILKKMRLNPVKNAFGAWKGRLKESGIEYVDKLRETWNDRHHD